MDVRYSEVIKKLTAAGFTSKYAVTRPERTFQVRRARSERIIVTT